MNLSQFLLILRAHYKLIAITVLVTVAAALGVSLLKHKTYKATTALVLNYKGTDPVTGQAMPSQLMPGYMSTQVELVTSMSVALRVVDALKLADGPLVKQKFLDATDGEGNVRDWIASGLLDKLDVAPLHDSSVLNITYTGYERQMAANVANAFGAAYQQVSVQLKVDPSKKTSVYFNDQVKQLRDNFELAQQRLSAYQHDHGIVNANADKSLDVETVRLNELSSQLVTAQGQAMEARARQHHAGGAASPDVTNNPMIQNLKVELGSAESKFSDIEQKMGKNHPLYVGAKAEVDKLRAGLAAQTQITSEAIGTNANILQQRSGQVRSAVEAQRGKVLQLNRSRDELAVLGREVDSAQRAYETIAQRLTLTNLEGQANQSDIAVLTPALAPLKAFGPKIVLNTLVALVVGLMLGVGGAVMLELLNRRVRSSADLAELVGLPVLCVIKRSGALPRQTLGKPAPPRRDPPGMTALAG